MIRILLILAFFSTLFVIDRDAQLKRKIIEIKEVQKSRDFYKNKLIEIKLSNCYHP